MIETVDRQVMLMFDPAPAAQAAVPRRTTIDIAPFRRQVRHILQESIAIAACYQNLGERLDSLIGYIAWLIPTRRLDLGIFVTSHYLTAKLRLNWRILSGEI
ncbi:hypothetical protein AB3R30_13545 [Leptolyngbyaceae cyanobacterium UHCC 1019]